MKTSIKGTINIFLNVKIYFFILALIISTLLKVKAQYKPFNTEDASWKIRVKKSYCPDGDCGFKEYRIEGNTTINSKTYGTVYLYTQKPFEPNVSREYFASIRNSISEKRVYSIKKGQNEEAVLYDFNIEINDTITILEDTATVVSIDSVQVGLNYNRRYNLESIRSEPGYDYIPYSIIEGVGSTNGLFERVGLVTVNYSGTTLICYKEGGNPLYPSISGADCKSLVSSLEGYGNLFELNVYPNPARSYCIISKTVPKLVCSIYRVSGSYIRSVNISNTKEQIDLSGFSPGVYILKFISSDRYYATRMLTIQ